MKPQDDSCRGGYVGEGGVKPAIVLFIYNG